MNSTSNLNQLLSAASALMDRNIYNSEAEIYCRRAYEIAPDNSDVLLQYGRLHYGRGRHTEARPYLEAAFAKAPDHSGNRIMLFACYKDGQVFDKMLEMADLLSTSPTHPEEVVLAYTAYLYVCDWKRAEKIQQQVFDSVLSGEITAGLMPAILLESNGIPDLSPELIYGLHRQWGKLNATDSSPHRPEPIRGRIRIAYVSGDFYRHPVGYFILQVIAQHHRNEFEVFCYGHMAGKHDDVTDMFIEHADHFIDITDDDDAGLQRRMQQDNIHIAIDLSTHTTHARTSAFARRLAPVQISYLGYPNTSGLAEVDFHITDRYAEAEEGGTIYAEAPLYMPKTFLCYGMEWEVEKKKTTPCEESGIVTFASFNDSRKLNLAVVETWSEILKQAPNSRLLLKFVGSGNPLFQQNVHDAFAGFGIDKKRVELLPRTATVTDHILAYHQVDIVLDPFPYTGTTTTCEALSQGVPVITLVGNLHANRVSYSILKNIGFEETIAHSREEYVTKAVNLANNPKGLNILRECLPLLLHHSPLRQTENFVRDYEALLKQACIQKGIALEPGAVDFESSNKAPAQPNVADNPLGLPGLKEERRLLICDRLTPQVWDVIHQHVSDTDQSRKSILIALVPQHDMQPKIMAYLNEMNVMSANPQRSILSANIEGTVNANNVAASILKHCSALVVPAEEESPLQSVAVDLANNTGVEVVRHHYQPAFSPEPMPPLEDFKVTVVLPTWNRLDLLKRAVEAILKQSYRNFELIISDNASNDGTQRYCQKLAKKDKRVRYTRNKENIGAANNAFKLFEMVETDLFVIASDDDLIYPNHLELMVDAFRQHPDMGMVFGQCDMGNVALEIDTRGALPSNYTESCQINPQQMMQDSIKGNNICLTTCLIRKSAVMRMAEYSGRLWGKDLRHVVTGEGDYYFNALMAMCAPVYYVDVPTGFYAIHETSGSSQFLGGGWSMEIRLRTVDYIHKMYLDRIGMDNEEGKRLANMVATFRQQYQQIIGALSEEQRQQNTEKLQAFEDIIRDLATASQS